MMRGEAKKTRKTDYIIYLLRWQRWFKVSYLVLDFYVFVQHAAEFVVVSIPLKRLLPALLEEPFPILRRAKVCGSSGQQTHFQQEHLKILSVHDKSSFLILQPYSTWQLALVSGRTALLDAPVQKNRVLICLYIEVRVTHCPVTCWAVLLAFDWSLLSRKLLVRQRQSSGMKSPWPCRQVGLWYSWLETQRNSKR